MNCPNGPAELITHGEDGLLVPLGDIEKSVFSYCVIYA